MGTVLMIINTALDAHKASSASREAKLVKWFRNSHKVKMHDLVIAGGEGANIDHKHLYVIYIVY